MIVMSAEPTKRQNLNRRYMKLEVWQRGMDLFEMVFKAATIHFPRHD